MSFKSYEILLAIQCEMASRNILITHGDRKVQGQRIFFFFYLKCPVAPSLRSMWIIEKEQDLKPVRLRASMCEILPNIKDRKEIGQSFPNFMTILKFSWHHQNKI